MFKWKLLHYILPSKEMLNQWKITESYNCNFCKLKEDYQHLFIDCPFNNYFWDKISTLLDNLDLGRHIINMKNIVFGYKIWDEAYYELNVLITLISFSIYKSEKKITNIDLWKVFKNELRNYIEVRMAMRRTVPNVIIKARRFTQ